MSKGVCKKYFSGTLTLCKYRYPTLFVKFKTLLFRVISTFISQKLLALRTMDKYGRVPKEKQPQEAIGVNEIRVMAEYQRTARNYISYAINLLSAEV